MSLLVMCTNPQCGEFIDVPDSAVGKKLLCPKCGTIIQIGGGGGVEASAGPTAPASPAPCVPPAAPPAVEQAGGHDEFSLAPVDESGETPRVAGTACSGAAVASRSAVPPAPKAPPPPDEANDLDLSVLGEAPPAAPAQAPARPPSAKPQRPAERTQEIRFDDDWLAQTPVSTPAEDPVLEQQTPVRLVFILSLAGLVGGLVAGVWWFHENPLVGGYAGAAVGGLAMFVLGFLGVLSAQRDAPRRVQCAICKTANPPDMEHCRFCGASLVSQHYASLSGDCLSAGRYGLTHMAAVLALAAQVAVVYLLSAGGAWALGTWPAAPQEAWWALWAVVGLIGAGVLCYWLSYMTRIVSSTILRGSHMPDLPGLNPLEVIPDGARALVVTAMYLLPILPMPLLPMALMWLGTPQAYKAFRMRDSLATARRLGRDLAVLWLVLLLWLAALAVGVLALVLAGRLLDFARPGAEASGLGFDLAVGAAQAFGMGAMAMVFGSAMFRCIGLLGRCNAFDLLRPQDRSAAIKS